MPPYSMGAQTLNGCIGHEEVGGTSRQQLRRKYAHKIDVEVFNLPLPYRLFFLHVTQHALAPIFGDLRALDTESRDVKNRHCGSDMT